ncbi:MAG: CPBP family intramembrane metalloprotease [Candidatus Dormibacteraeota bacterium]|nr:CPBP family intramembrane metalloprotease [Candidatus Dormibacteraeota bacterium]
MLISLPRHAGRSATRALLLLAGLAAAASLRTLIGRPDPAASLPAALLFAGLLSALAAATGVRPARPRIQHLVAGAAAGLALFAVWATVTGSWIVIRPEAPRAELLVWSVVVSLVAVAEEVLLRGALFSAVAAAGGEAAALVATSLAFALIHVPLYGWQAVPVDLGIGFVLGSLRLLSGGVAAPAAAHALLDLLAGCL